MKNKEKYNEIKEMMEMTDNIRKLTEYLERDYRKESKEDLAILLHNSSYEICCVAHGPGVKEKNFLVAGLLSKACINVLKDSGFSDWDEITSALVLLDIHNLSHM